jgi:outer membrane receptor for ferrienterochelin and colicin
MAWRSWLIGLVVACAPGVALAQSEAAKPAPAEKPAAQKPAAKAPASKTVEGVTVTAGTPDVQTSIDRRSFTLGKDLMATTGSIGDALRNIPSVEVDLQGNLSMRGDSNVTILVDGKPAPQFQGAGRADALQQLSADQFERVEVITNPSAALNPEGSGGVINLISKKSRGAGTTASAYATVGSAGSKRAGVTFGYNSPKLSVTASVSGNYQRNKGHAKDLRDAVDPTTGALSANELDGIGRNLTRTPTERLNLSYALTPKDQLTGSVQLNQMLVEGHPFNRYVESAGDGTLLGLQNRQGSRRFTDHDSALTGSWKHSFSGEGHEVSVDVTQNHTD